MEVVVGGTYKHFKGTLHKVIALAKHSETQEEMVVYTHEDTGEIWVRPYEMFTSKVDKEKYPEVNQEYRFEYIGE
ncbi:MAG: DUF1653 domain-containing protein [Bacilli bacterium]|nr:DUF1653 domain-containing protein [Bacilli bacterium]